VAPRRTKAIIETERLAARRLEAYELYISGWTQAKIAKRFEVDQSTISDDLKLYRASIPQVDRDAIRKDHLEQLQRIRHSMNELVEMAGAPVTAGKDGDVVRDPDTGAVVRDFALRIQASKLALAVIEREAKQLGSDADTKIAVSGEVRVVGSVDAELEDLAAQLGLNDDALPSTSNADASS
jgi:hypothetical protein